MTELTFPTLMGVVIASAVIAEHLGGYLRVRKRET